MSHFCNNDKLSLAKILEKSRCTASIIIISYLYASKSSHFVIFQVQLRAQISSYDSETSNKRCKKSKAPTSHFCSNGKLSLAKNLGNKLIRLYLHYYYNKLQLFYQIVGSKTMNKQDEYNKNRNKSESLITAFNDYRIHYFDLAPARVVKHMLHYCAKFV